MIYIKAYKIVILDNGKRMLERTTLPNGEKFIELENYQDFDILEPENWREFLANEPIYNGMRLPHKTEDGLQRVHYVVHTLGVESETYKYFNSFIKAKPGKLNIGTKFYLFPGYYLEEGHPKYGKRKDVKDFGWIRFDDEED